MTHPGRWVDPYAGMAGRRLFVAVRLPSSAAAAIAELVDHVRAMPLPVGAHDVRWVRMDGLHLTLRFLGPTPDARIPPTETAIARAASRAGAIAAELGGSGTFPEGRRPRTLWIGMTAGAEGLASLAEVVDDELVTAGWPSEHRPFRAHLTLARSDGIGAGPLVADRLATVLGERRIGFTIDRLGLFESLTGGGPARYLSVFEADLPTS